MAALQRTQPIYFNDNANVRVWRGLLNSQPVAIKDCIYFSLDQANATIKEGLLMASLHHPAICRVYDCFLEKCEEGYKAVLVVELLEGDLAAEISRRYMREERWSEGELLGILGTVVSGLCAAKSKGVAHRDIKPQNLFISGSTVKIGDFGSAAFDPIANYQRSTLQGTPYYLSPELKEKYARVLLHESDSTEYNPFTSDVYSLGLTMVYLALLQAPEELTRLENLRRDTAKVVQKLSHYPLLQGILVGMLEVDQSCRVTLEELQVKLESLPESSPEVPSEPSIPTPIRTICSGCPSICHLDSVPLACSHSFHSPDCLFRNMRAQTQGFTLGNTPTCPICSAPISQEHLCSIYGTERYEAMVASEYLSKCCVCHERDVQVSYKKCAHLCCGQCQMTVFSVSVCPICSKWAKVVSFGAGSRVKK